MRRMRASPINQTINRGARVIIIFNIRTRQQKTGSDSKGPAEAAFPTHIGTTQSVLNINRFNRRRDLPSKSLLGSVVSIVSRTRAAFLLRTGREGARQPTSLNVSFVSPTNRVGERARAGLLPRVVELRSHNCLRNLPELGESQLGSPDLALAAETVGADQLEPVHSERDHARKLVSRPLATDSGAVRRVYRLRVEMECLVGTRTYSLISFSFSKGLLGFLEVFLSGQGKQRSGEQIVQKQRRTCGMTRHLQFVYFFGIWKD